MLRCCRNVCQISSFVGESTHQFVDLGDQLFFVSNLEKVYVALFAYRRRRSPFRSLLGGWLSRPHLCFAPATGLFHLLGSLNFSTDVNENCRDVDWMQRFALKHMSVVYLVRRMLLASSACSNSCYFAGASPPSSLNIRKNKKRTLLKLVFTET